MLILRDVKHPTSVWRGGAKNTHGQFGVANVRILTINLRDGGYKVKDIMNMNLEIEVEKTHL